MESLYRQSDLTASLGFEDFSETMNFVARAYSLNPGKLRVRDRFVAVLRRSILIGSMTVQK